MSLYITYLLTFCGAAGSLIHPFYGLIVYVMFALLKPEQLWSYNISEGNYSSRIVAIAMLFGWLIRGFGSWKLGKGWAITLCLILHVAWVGFGAFFVSPNFTEAYSVLDIMLKILVPFLVGMTTIKSVRELKILAVTMVLCEGYLAYELNAAYYFSHFNRLTDDFFLGNDNNGNGIILVAATGFALCLAMDTQRWLVRFFYGGIVAMLINAICFSESRGAMLALLITGGVVFVLMPKKAVHYLMFACVIAVGIRLAGPSTVERFSTIFGGEDSEVDDSAQSRLVLWNQAMSVMWKNPLTGVGPGQWSAEAAKFGWTAGKQVHSTWIQNGAEGGVFGFSIYLAFYLICIARAGRIAWRPTPEELEHPFLVTASRMVTASLIGFMIAAQFVTGWSLEMPYYVNLIGALALKLRDTLPSESNLSADDDWEPDDMDEYDDVEFSAGATRS